MTTIEAGQRIALENILVATDSSSCSGVAFQYAVSIAARYGAEIHSAHVQSSMAADALPTSNKAWAAFDVLLPITQDWEIDLLVLGTHGSSVGNPVMSLAAEETLLWAPFPILSVSPRVSCEPCRDIEFQRILFATDFSKESLAALPYAVSFAEEDAARLALLHVVEQPVRGIADIDRVTESFRNRLRELVPSDAELWCYVEPLVEFSPQFAARADRILKVAHDLKADLIVLGLRPVHSKLGSITHLATTTAQILSQANCPVLTVRG